jgi:hypothetical protein
MYSEVCVIIISHSLIVRFQNFKNHETYLIIVIIYWDIHEFLHIALGNFVLLFSQMIRIWLHFVCLGTLFRIGKLIHFCKNIVFTLFFLVFLRFILTPPRFFLSLLARCTWKLYMYLVLTYKYLGRTEQTLWLLA